MKVFAENLALMFNMIISLLVRRYCHFTNSGPYDNTSKIILVPRREKIYHFVWFFDFVRKLDLMRRTFLYAELNYIARSNVVGRFFGFFM